MIRKIRGITVRCLGALLIGVLAGGIAEPTDAGLATAEGGLGPIALPAPKAGRDRPLVAVLAANAGTETTDFIVPYGVLSASGAADVVALAMRPEPVRLMPALTVRLDQTGAGFDRRHPQGADIVVVPALHDADDPEVIAWLRRQSASGAVVVGVCDGVLVLAKAGLLQGRQATGHWFSLDGLRRDHPETRWIEDRRYVADGQVITTTGVTASMPVTLALIEAIAGEALAMDTARMLGVADYGPGHDSDAFRLSARPVITALGNLARFWGRETIGLAVQDGVDEIALALAADAWSRTYRSRARTVGPERVPVTSKRGLTIEVEGHHGTADHTPTFGSERPAEALDVALAGIADRYGEHTASFVSLQLEYAR